MSATISMFVPAGIIAALAVPLVLNRVPPNRWYGIRTAQTLADRDVWYRVNRFGGWALLAAVFLTTCLYLAQPELASGESVPGVLALIVPVLVAVLAAAVYARSIAHRDG